MSILEIFLEHYPLFFKGLGMTLLMTVVAMILGTILGIFLALGKIYGNKVLSRIISIYIEIFRGTPLLVQLFILYFGLPVRLSALTASLIGFTLNSGAYQAEYLRGSIQSISSGQLRAALSLGMSRWQGIFYIILPQALRRVVPSWTNEFIYLLKYTSLSYSVGAPELMAQAKYIASRNYEYFKVFLIAGVIYLIVVIFFTNIFNVVVKKYKIPGFEYKR